MMKKMTSTLAKNIIKNYKSIIDRLYKDGLILRHNELSYKNENNECKLEYYTKNEHSNVLYDSSIRSIDLYDSLFKHNQFNIEFKDGSLLLFQCLISKDVITKQRIIFIKPFLNDYNDDDMYDDSWESYQNADNASDLLNFPLIIRADYNSDEFKSDHPVSHLTLSNIASCRIPVVANISFGRFVEFILHQIFNRYDIDLVKPNYARSIRAYEEKMVHISWK